MIRGLFIILLLFFYSCKFNNPVIVNEQEIQIKIAKWYNNYPAAIVVTFDSNPLPEIEQHLQDYAARYNVPINYEMVTSEYLNSPEHLSYILNNKFISFHGIYGHGHYHFLHDQLSYEESLKSFSQCYRTMDSLGLPPVAYAYPGGYGYKLSTRKALKESGFLCGRRYEQLDHEDAFICADNISEPEDWYSLPSLVMQAYDYDACEACINNTQELIPFLDRTLQKTALLILTYHSVGNKSGYGFYYAEDFYSDIKEVSNRNFWKARFSDVVLYIYERNTTKYKASVKYNSDNQPVVIEIDQIQNLKDKKFNMDLTLKFTIPSEYLNKKLLLRYDGELSGQIIFKTREVVLNIPVKTIKITLAPAVTN